MTSLERKKTRVLRNNRTCYNVGRSHCFNFYMGNKQQRWRNENTRVFPMCARNSYTTYIHILIKNIR